MAQFGNCIKSKVTSVICDIDTFATAMSLDIKKLNDCVFSNTQLLIYLEKFIRKIL